MYKICAHNLSLKLRYLKFIILCVIVSLFLTGCATRQKLILTDANESKRLIKSVSDNYKRIGDLSGYINLNVEIKNRQLALGGYFFYKNPDLLKINFMGWFGIPQAALLINKGAKVYLYKENITYNIDEASDIFDYDIIKKNLSDGFKLTKLTAKYYVFSGEKSKIWVNKSKPVINKMEIFDENKNITTKVEFKSFKNIENIFVPQRIQIRLYDPAQLEKAISLFSELSGYEKNKLFKSMPRNINISIYLKDVSVNKGLKEDIFNFGQK